MNGTRIAERSAGLSPMNSKSTQIGTALLSSASTHTRSKVAAHCPECGAGFEGRPFCKRDGTLASSFELGGRYRIEETLGTGGMAFVFGAKHLVLGRPVAVKVLRNGLPDPEDAQRFLREARLSSQLVHENIVGVTDFGHDAELDLHYLVMDRLRGPTLAKLMESTGAMAVERAVPILVQLLRALSAAHEQGVIHRDLTPRNIVLEELSGRRDVVKLCDFGVSRTIEGNDRLTMTGQILGTPAYMAPEQIRGDADQDARVDVYSFGVVAYEMLTGKLPYDAPTPIALLAAKLRDRATPITARGTSSRVPRALETAILRCLETEPGERLSVAELTETLTQLSFPRGVPLAPADLVGLMVGSYRVMELVGTGGMGSIYRAEHPEIGTEVAIKVLLPEVAGSTDAVARFSQEARASSAIGSTHIPRYYDFGRLSDGRAYAVMEFLEGESVAKRLSRRGPFSVDEAARFLRDVARALGEAHALGIVHRDIKPENLFIAQNKKGEESIKVLDFGIAKLTTSREAAEQLTQTGEFVGTPTYCAPEQIFGHSIGPATDIYALGATAYEMLTGTPPFTGDFSDIFASKGREMPPSVRAIDASIPERVDITLRRALASRAAERFGTMEEFEEALRAWETSDSSSIEKTPNHRARVLASMGVLSFAALAVLAWYVLWNPRNESVPPPTPTFVESPPSIETVDVELDVHPVPDVVNVEPNDMNPPGIDIIERPIERARPSRRAPRHLRETPASSPQGTPSNSGNARPTIINPFGD